jgi:hypothetical protein
MKRDNFSLHRAHSRGDFSRLLFESETSNGGGDESRSFLFRLCQLGVLAFRLVTPFSYLYLSTLFALKLQPAQFFGGSAMYFFLLVWMLVEALFLPYYYYLFTQFSKRNGDLEHFASDKQVRVRVCVCVCTMYHTLYVPCTIHNPICVLYTNTSQNTPTFTHTHQYFHTNPFTLHTSTRTLPLS